MKELNDFHKSIIEHVHCFGKQGLLLRDIVKSLEGNLEERKLKQYLVACVLLTRQGYLRFNPYTDKYLPGDKDIYYVSPERVSEELVNSIVKLALEVAA